MEKSNLQFSITPFSRRIAEGQDGAIYGDFLFRFNEAGKCNVYSMPEQTELGEFILDKNELISPHGNSVCFGRDKLEPSDEFPLLYTNIYNNYSEAEDKMEGVCLVYRLMRNGSTFSSSLVQILRIAFADNTDYWRSSKSGDVRPYGNFTVDTENGILYAFTMRDKERVTRYFAFDIPKPGDGVRDEYYGCELVYLNIEDIKSSFDSEYSNYLQGACFHDGKIYSLEGFGGPDVPPRLRVIDMMLQRQCGLIDLYALGITNEPELADFYDGKLCYADAYGNMWTFEFE